MSNKKKQSESLIRGNVVVNCPEYRVGFFCRGWQLIDYNFTIKCFNTICYYVYCKIKAFVLDYYDSKTAKVKLYANKKDYKVKTELMFKLSNPNSQQILKVTL